MGAFFGLGQESNDQVDTTFACVVGHILLYLKPTCNDGHVPVCYSTNVR